jgi:competence protein ComEA
MKSFIFLVCAGVLCVSLFAQDPPDPLPDGEGKKVVQKLCLDCHGPENFTAKKLTKKEWEKVINDMIQSGASGTDEEFDIVVKYLTKNFGKPEDKQR